MNIRILHLFPDLMNLYGEYGNVLMLKRCFEESGLNVTLDKKDIGDSYDIMSYDIVYIGSGTESASYKALEELMPHKREIGDYIEKNKILIATGNAFELFGDFISDDKKGTFDGLKIFGYGVQRNSKKRYLGDAVFTCMHDDNKVIGFVNKCSDISGVSSPLFNVLMGLGNDNNRSTEGFCHNNFYGTSLIGPLLVRNPYFCQYIIKTALKNIDFTTEITPNMSLEARAYEIALAELTALMKKK